MSDVEIFKDFLIRLKYKVDTVDEDKFNKSVLGATKKTLGMATAVVGAVAAAGYALHEFAQGYDRLYFVSKRANTSVGGIKSIEYAFKQLGGSAEDADAAIQSVANFMKYTPGAEGILKGWGIGTRDANGELLKTDKLMANIGSKLKDLPQYMRPALASLFGLSEQDQYFLTSGNFSKYVSDWEKLSKGIDFEKASEGAHKYETRLRSIGESISNLKVSVFNSIYDLLTGEDAKARQEAALKRETPEQRAIRLKRIADKKAKEEDSKKNPGWIARTFFGAKRDTSQQTASGKVKILSEEVPPSATPPVPASAPSSVPVATTRGLRNNNPGNLNFAGQAGATKEQGPGGRFAVFATQEAGLHALALQLTRYASRGLNTVESIIKTYAPKNENNTEAYVSSVSRHLGVSAGSQLNMKDPVVLAQFMKAVELHENAGKNPYSDSQYSSAASSVTINPVTNINVAAGPDANSTAQAVARSQDRVNASMARTYAPRSGASSGSGS